MKEAQIQSKILKYLKAIPGSFTMKISDIWYSGYPDICFIRNGRAYFFEVKRPGGARRPLQVFTIAALCEAGARAHFVESLDEVKKILDRK